MIIAMAAFVGIYAEQWFLTIDSKAAVDKWAASNSDLALGPGGKGLQVTFKPSDWPSTHFTPSKPLDWSESGYLVIDVKNPGTEPVEFGVRVDDGAPADGYNHSRQAMTTLAPGEKKTVALAAGMDPNSYGMNGVPGAKGLFVLGSYGAPGWNPKNIVDLQLFMHLPKKPTTLVFDNFRLAAAVSMVGIVDRFGQYTGETWPGKLASEAEFAKRKETESAELLSRPSVGGRDKFGGWAAGPKLNATGFFRTEKVDGRWWLVDPEGRLFFSVGVDCVALFNTTFVTGRESMFTWMPRPGEPLAEFLNNTSTDHGGKHFEGKAYSFQCANLVRKYGKEWRTAFAETALKRLPSWGFNTIGNWSERSLYRNNKVPYVATMGIWGSHKRVASGNDYWGTMHDPFDPEFRVSVQKSIADTAKLIKGDPWCVGTFVDNELSWAGQGPEEGRYGLSLGALSYGAESPAKMAFVEQLKAKHKTIEALNIAWGTAFSSWDALSSPAKGPWQFTDSQKNDMAAFVALLSETYHRIVREELKKLDPDHLYLGCRFAWYARDAVFAAAKYADVISFNIYSPAPERAKWNWINEIGKPVIIGEFHFGALDRGMFHPGLVDARSQAGRAKMYQEYIRAVADNPAFVGCHWFQYCDEPLTGRTLDGENYQIGMIDVTDTPYPEAVASAREIHRQVYELHSKAK